MRVTWFAGTVAFLGLLAASAVVADEEKVPLDKVPAAVLKAVKEKFPGAELKQAEKETEEGKTTYEIGLKHDGHNIDISLKDDGTILEIEKEIATKDLPSVVSATLKAKYPEGTIKKAEEITKGKSITYEVVVKVAGKDSFEVVLDPMGKILEEERD